jgi:hypothetical protein
MFFRPWQRMALIMAIQSRLNSQFQSCSNAWPRKTDCLILRRAPRDARDHSVKETVGKKPVTH